jgi:glucan phosphoethanolaminetransferase (alkaline phosphatase superfamily)
MGPEPRKLRFCISTLAFFTFFDWIGLYFRVDIAPNQTTPLHQILFLFSAIAILSLGVSLALMRLFDRTTGFLHFVRVSVVPLVFVTVFGAIAIQAFLWLSERYEEARVQSKSGPLKNVLVIITDTLGADHLSAYGYGRQTSPQLDSIETQGVLFDNAFAASSWSLPSHASLLTGEYPHQHHAELKGLNQSVPTIAEALRDQGYRTAAFSANRLFFSRRVGLDRGFIHFEDYFDSVNDAVYRTFYGNLFIQLLERLGFESVVP